MADLITPNSSHEPYNAILDLTEFATEVTQACRKHPGLPPAMMIGALEMIKSDLHHNVVAEMNHQQMAQAALAKANADRLKRLQ